MPDVIAVRPEERFDEDRLASYLCGNLPGADADMTVSQFGGGRANLTYLLQFADGTEYVLRRPPLGPVAPGAHDMGREYRVLSRLWQAFEKAPRAFLYCDDPSVIGAAFFVMERKDGVVVRETVPEIFGGGDDVDANAALSRVVIDTLAEFHAVDPAACGLEGIGHPDGFLERQVNGWLERWERARHADNPLADEVGTWLIEQLPTSPPPTLLHNDWRLDNMAVAPDDPSVCAAVFDWDMATRGDPLCDLGTVLGSWHDSEEVDREAHSLMPVTVPGWMPRAEAIARYAQGSGRDVSGIDWYVVFGTWKLGVILEQIYIRFVRGQTSDERFASMGEGAARLFELAASRRG
ncbi:MAG TPA: phosphotransferase family protein [Acidimicrobiia bacterium]|nr:phosphotransferase family protein [Acidimicrobiia bacterium]